jgi:hypothetical protein
MMVSNIIPVPPRTATRHTSRSFDNENCMSYEWMDIEQTMPHPHKKPTNLHAQSEEQKKDTDFTQRVHLDQRLHRVS